jgi:hypothetical protein
MPFVKGQSGNPAGRPVGSRNKFTRDMQDALEEAAPKVVEVIVEHATDANPAAMRLYLDRLMGKHRPSRVELPSPDAPDYTVAALKEIHRALGAGEIASDEATRLVDFVGRTARVLASKAAAEIDVAERLARCEEALLLLLNAGRPAAASIPAEAAASPAAPTAAEEPAIDINNAETIPPSALDAGRTIAVALAADLAAREGQEHRVNGTAIDRLMDSASPLADLAAMAGKMPPLPPDAGIAAG